MAAAGAIAAAQGQPPRFRSGVQVTLLDMTVLDGNGQPVTGLRPTDFTMSVDGADRRVVSAEWIPLAAARPPARTRPAGASRRVRLERRRARRPVDRDLHRGREYAVRAGRLPAPHRGGLHRRLEPSDRVALTHTCPGAKLVPFTTDRAAIKNGLMSMVGDRRRRCARGPVDGKVRRLISRPPHDRRAQDSGPGVGRPVARLVDRGARPDSTPPKSNGLAALTRTEVYRHSLLDRRQPEAARPTRPFQPVRSSPDTRQAAEPWISAADISGSPA